MSHAIGDPRQAGESGPAGDQRKAGESGPAGDTRPPGGHYASAAPSQASDKPRAKKSTKAARR